MIDINPTTSIIITPPLHGLLKAPHFCEYCIQTFTQCFHTLDPLWVFTVPIYLSFLYPGRKDQCMSICPAFYKHLTEPGSQAMWEPHRAGADTELCLGGGHFKYQQPSGLGRTDSPMVKVNLWYPPSFVHFPCCIFCTQYTSSMAHRAGDSHQTGLFSRGVLPLQDQLQSLAIAKKND